MTVTLSRSSTSVSLKARKVLILGQMPSYGEHLRRTMEAIHKNSMTNNYFTVIVTVVTRLPFYLLT